jgi:hypothetical protein
MKERPILFSAPMVRALLDGTKTQTRRVLKPQPVNDARFFSVDPGLNMHGEQCGLMAWFLDSDDCGLPAGRSPYGQPGDRLWLVGNGTVTPFEGDLDDYRAQLGDRTRPAAKTESKGDDRKGKATVRAAAAPLRARAKEIEARLQKVIEDASPTVVAVVVGQERPHTSRTSRTSCRV